MIVMMVDAGHIDLIAKRYSRLSLLVLAALVLLSVAVGFALKVSVMVAVSVSFIFNLVLCQALSKAWSVVARKSPAVLPKFYLAVSVLRMIAALVVVLVFCVIARESHAIRDFAITFIVFYIIMLVFESVYFAKIEKSNKTYL